MRYNYNPPAVVKSIFKAYKWNTTNGKILLTFDDGPLLGNTRPILNALERHEIKAMFFCVGNNIEKEPELVKEILSRGHEIGNHTYNHKIITKLSAAEIDAEIDPVSRLMEDKFNYKIKYFRPPHGKFGISTKRILAGKNLTNVMWSLLTQDYNNDFKVVKFAVTKYLERDSIIVLHDSLKSKDIILDSINFIVDYANGAGFEFGEPLECLK